jgi:hypothetical protein
MQESIKREHKGSIVFIGVMAMLFTVACGDHANGEEFKKEDKFTAIMNSLDAQSRYNEKAPAVEEVQPQAAGEAAAVAPAEVSALSQAEEKAEDAASDVVTMDPESNTVTKSDMEATGEEFWSGKDMKSRFNTKPLVEPVLKKMDVNKIGASPYYETYEGLRLLKYFTVAQRVEIYQEARSIDSYIMDVFAMRQTNWPHVAWNNRGDYRAQLVPLFTRAYGTEITFSDPKNKEGQIRYTHDYREMYKTYYPKWPQIKREMWDQNEILLMHSKQIDPIGWSYTSNLGYRYSTMTDKENETWSSWRPNNMAPEHEFDSYDKVRHTYFASLSLAPSEKLEWFGQGEYFKERYTNIAWDYQPDHFMGRTELRIKSNDLKTMFVPSFSYSKDYYMPFADTYQKYEMQFRVGRDWSKRFSTSSTTKYVMGFTDTPDHNDWNGPGGGPVNVPYKAWAHTLALENRFSYNIYDRLYIQSGLDFSTGLNVSTFDNLGLLGGLEYYAPGMIRVDVGWTGNYYYNVQDVLSCVYFKVFFFM